MKWGLSGAELKKLKSERTKIKKQLKSIDIYKNWHNKYATTVRDLETYAGVDLALEALR